jgi:hypothetical protein
MFDFFQFLQAAIGAPTAKLFIVSGLVFLGVAIVGSITGRIQPGPIGRILGGLAGPLLIVVGLGLEMEMTMPSIEPAVAASVVATATPEPKLAATPKPSIFRVPPEVLDNDSVPWEDEDIPDEDLVDYSDLGPYGAADTFTAHLAALNARRQTNLDQLQRIQQEYDRKALGLIND